MIKITKETHWRAMLFSVLAMSVSLSNAQEKFELKSPSGLNHVSVALGTKLSWTLYNGEERMLEPSSISLDLGNGRVWGHDPKLRKVSRTSHKDLIHPPVYRKKVIKDEYNELTLDFKDYYSVVFRAYDDGVAYRFVSNEKKPFVIISEEASFNIGNDSKAYIATPKGRLNNGVEDPFYSSFQNTYNHIRISEWNDGKPGMLPLLLDRENGKKICITEADLIDYPGMYLTKNTVAGGLSGLFAPYPKHVVTEVKGLKGVVKSRENYIAKIAGQRAFPWRVAIVSSKDQQLLDNDMVYKLATPAKFSDFSWIKPGKVAWDWWNNWNVYNVDFNSGVNNETYKYYIDFAAKNKIEYVILDEGWSVEGKADLFQVVPQINLPDLISYAQKGNVGIILWAGYKAFDKDMDAICKHYASMGVKGFKIDFMDRDDQQMIDFNYRAAEAGAKHRLLIDLHGTSKPTGLQRTFPNTINFEGVHGLEEMKWAKPELDQVKYDVTMPFIRMVAGPVDYTQGAMRNANKDNFRTVYTEPMSQGTRCRQLAEYVVFESPLNMLCDAPSNYIKEPECTKFIAAIPTVWDEVIPLDSKIGEYVAIARRKGDTWYVGALTDWTARDIVLDLSFLEAGSYEAEIFKDGINVDKVAEDYKREVKKVLVTESKVYNAHLASGGGFIMKLKKK
ncbi:glycoside hydrolase family 97 protein [Pedobacter sp. N36a]|uniref:glycoside hydrolase family 97 protein n=1 Tax=Pedobacter sp. N36a TaxID=2767996 RepID=UPI00165747B9|nr:glycoside hydrolase family 97 protein [Pedobacter sp. N36a]MBC8988010.1 glycoside hydrolase family 97 protein [Pedobacter sp. N36a]